MRTSGEGNFYCAHCGFDCTPIPKEPGNAHEMCPARDGDVCEPKRRTRKARKAARS
jgi:putative hemolysin